MSNVFSECRDLVRSAVPTFAAKAFLLCFAGARSRAKSQVESAFKSGKIVFAKALCVGSLRRLSDREVFHGFSICFIRYTCM